MELGVSEFSKEKLDKFIELIEEISKIPVPPPCIYITMAQYEDMLKKGELNDQ